MTGELPPLSEPALLFLGDSFTLGRQVPEAERFASLVAKRLHMVALNFGNSSACPLLSRLQLEYFADRVAPRAVVYQMYANDVRDEQEMRRLAQRDSAGRVVAVPGHQQGFWIPLVRQSYVARLVRQVYLQWSFSREQRRRGQQSTQVDPWSPLHPRPLTEFYSDQERADVEESLTQLATFCRSRGWPLFLCVVPDRGALRDGLTDNYAEFFRDFAAKHGQRYIDLAPAMAPYAGPKARELYFAQDIHLTAAGHAVVADAIAAALEADPNWNRAASGTLATEVR